MKITYSKKFLKSYNKLPLQIRKKVDRQIKHLTKDISYPSLRTKKMQGIGRWEARIDRSYRFTFDREEDSITIRTVGPHDEGLGKR